MRLGVPLARGTCSAATEIALMDSLGAPRAVEGRALDRWPDGSVRWLLLDFFADHDGDEDPARYELRCGIEPMAAPEERGIAVAVAEDSVVVETGAAGFRVQRGAPLPFAGVTVGGRTAIDATRSGLEIRDGAGRSESIAVERVIVEEQGRLRAVVRVEGHFPGPSGGSRLDVTGRLHFFAGSATARVEITIRNPERAVHPGGIWELGDPGSAYLSDVSLTLRLPSDAESVSVWCSPEPGMPLERYAGEMTLYQASSGGEHWESRNHVDRDGRVPFEFNGYRLRAGDVRRDGRRAMPVVAVARNGHRLAVAPTHFWQNFPKALETDDGAIVFRLFPERRGAVHELQGGEQKTHVVHVAFGADLVSEIPLDWVRAPLFAGTTPEQYCSSGAVPYLVPSAEGADDLGLIGLALDGDDTFDRKRERIDEYGWRNFGDLPADHESVYYEGPPPIISHYNNQYDAIAGFAVQFMRSGDCRWWRHMVDLTAHVVDIDLYHTDRDKAAYNRGLFWHTFHYVDAGLSTHRSYPRSPEVHGGGPAAEHNYSSGLLLHYFLTGDRESRGSAIDLARWVIAMDDGSKTVLRWLAGADTGNASASGSTRYHGPGRAAGNSINVLINAHRLTGDYRFLEKAETLIRRCIHPADDIEARELLDTERRWYYTIFLHAIGGYLDYKRVLGEYDGTYDYARCALLAYARWMAEHECPYLTRPEKLEYPTETWAAQELWKSEVFNFAAVYGTAEDRPRMLERARFFFRYAITTLSGMATRTFTRPLVLLLSHGYTQAYFDRHPQTSAPAPPAQGGSFGNPERFVPQRERAKRTILRLIVAGIGLAAAGLAYFIHLASRVGLVLFRWPQMTGGA